jgi:methyl halide transferase
MKNADKHYWEGRWQHQQTGWDLGMVSPPLQQFIDSLPDKTLRILIPGCGNAHEAFYLLNNGFSNVTVIDIAPTLINALNLLLADHPAAQNIRTVCGDFFEHSGMYDIILEQTFFCAIDPRLRIQYAEQCHALLAPAGKLAGVLFNCAFEGGPPYGGNEAEYRQYFTSLFNIHKMELCLNSAGPRAGRELWIELIKS